MDDTLWHQAVQNNPDPNCLVPVLAVGFQDLHKRIAMQKEFQQAHLSKLKELEDKAASLEHQQECKTTIKLKNCQKRGLELQHRLKKTLHVLEKIRLAGTIPSEREERLRLRLEAVRKQVQSMRAIQKIEEIKTNVSIGAHLQNQSLYDQLGLKEDVLKAIFQVSCSKTFL